jgi:hypothetical protein
MSKKKDSPLGLIIGLLVALIVIIVLSLVIFAIPFGYTSTETYIEKEPSITEECYERDYRYESELVGFHQISDILYKITCKFTNLEEIDGTFDGGVSLLLTKIETKIVEETHHTGEFEIGGKSDYYFSTTMAVAFLEEYVSGKDCIIRKAPKINECKDKTIYKDTTKTRTITKYATLFQQWIGQAQ